MAQYSGVASTTSISSAVLDEGFGHRIADALAANGFDLALALFDVLNVDRGNDGNARLAKLFHILPAMRVLAAGGIAIGEPIDEAELRMPAEQRGHIDGGNAVARLRAESPPCCR